MQEWVHVGVCVVRPRQNITVAIRIPIVHVPPSSWEMLRVPPSSWEMLHVSPSSWEMLRVPPLAGRCFVYPL